MAWGIFSKDFNYDYRPAKSICQEVKASDEPQQVKRELLDAAIKEKAAVSCKSPDSNEKEIKEIPSKKEVKEPK